VVVDEDLPPVVEDPPEDGTADKDVILIGDIPIRIEVDGSDPVDEEPEVSPRDPLGSSHLPVPISPEVSDAPLPAVVGGEPSRVVWEVRWAWSRKTVALAMDRIERFAVFPRRGELDRPAMY